MASLSVIIPFAGEYPQVLFTIQSTAQVLHNSGIDFEIIAVDNWCDELVEQHKHVTKRHVRNRYVKMCKKLGMDPFESSRYNNQLLLGEFVKDVVPELFPFYEIGENRSGAAIEAAARGNKWLKYVKFDDRLSHWKAKRVGVEEASSPIYLFMDAHCVPSKRLTDMYRTYAGRIIENISDPDYEEPPRYKEEGTMHMPLSYKILEWRWSIYKMVIEADAYYTYSFTPYRPSQIPYEVPVMSTCGMIISKEVYDKVGGWPESLGIYGGGENFMNYTLGVLGLKKWIYPEAILHHHGEARDYHWNHDNIIYNRMLAHYLFGGRQCARKYRDSVTGKGTVLDAILDAVITNGADQRIHIAQQQVQTVEDFVEGWRSKSLESGK